MDILFPYYPMHIGRPTRYTYCPACGNNSLDCTGELSRCISCGYIFTGAENVKKEPRRKETKTTNPNAFNILGKIRRFFKKKRIKN